MTAVEPFAQLDRSTLRERALRALRTAITSGQYGPGDHLGEVELANRLGISRGTVREALRHLQQEGLVQAGPRGRLLVNSLTPEEVRGLYQVRAALEGLAAVSIIRSPDRTASVARLREELERLDEDDDFAGHVERDLGFHLLLCELAGNPMLVESWRHLEGRIRVAIMSHRGDNQLPGMMSEDRHTPIIEAIEQGDVPTALAVVEEHMQAAADIFTGQR